MSSVDENNKLIQDFMISQDDWRAQAFLKVAYDDHWDWMIPVVKKITPLSKDEPKLEGLMVYVMEDLLELDLDRLLLSVAKFIHYYNGFEDNKRRFADA